MIEPLYLTTTPQVMGLQTLLQTFSMPHSVFFHLQISLTLDVLNFQYFCLVSYAKVGQEIELATLLAYLR